MRDVQVEVPPARAATRWYAEPLLHFVLIGCTLFAANAWWEQRVPSQGSIVVSEGRVRAMAENFRRTWQRPPMAAELDGLIEEHIRDEVLTREAQRLGLDRDDLVIRRRLRQKIEIITEEAAAAVAPTDAQLNDYLQAHADDFRGEGRIAFAQVFLDPAKRGAQIDADAQALLAKLNAAPGGAPALPGDSLFVLKPQYGLTGAREIAATFGAEFAAALPAQPAGKWSGPVASGYGLHLVRVDQSVPAPVAKLEDIRPLVEREWRNVQRKQAAEAQYRALRSAYRIVIKRPGGAAAPPTPGTAR